MADKKKNSFRDMMLIIFVVVACFGFTIYGIIYLAGKVFSTEEKIEMAVPKPAPSVTNPDKGDILTFTSKPEIAPQEPAAQPGVMPPAAEPVIPMPAPKQQPPQPAKPPVVAQPAPKQTPKPETIPTPAPKAQPEPPKQTASAPVRSKSPAHGKYVVQIMSLKSQKAAEAEAAKFRNACPDAHVMRADLGAKGVWYRVRCGVTDSKDTAIRTQKKIAAEFKITPQVLANE